MCFWKQSLMIIVVTSSLMVLESWGSLEIGLKTLIMEKGYMSALSKPGVRI